jgi:nucleotide-binding universal stress UspA family protein
MTTAIKTILAVSEGGPDAAMSFRLATRVASLFGAAVDGLHINTVSGDAVRGFAGGEAMPLMMSLDDERLAARGQASQQAYKDLLEPAGNATYSAAETAQLDTLIAMGRSVDLVVLGRPGSDPENVAPATVESALFECSCATMIAPPEAGAGPFNNVIVAWNGSRQAARAVSYSMPFLQAARKVTLLVVGSTPQEVNAPYLARHLGRHGIATEIDGIDPGAVSGRARGRALLGYIHKAGADLVVMGAYGGSQALSFLGLGGATGKVISSCRVPLLMTH